MTFDELLQCPPYFVKNARSTPLKVGAVYRILDHRPDHRPDHGAYIRLLSIATQRINYEYLTIRPEYGEQYFQPGSAFAGMLYRVADSLAEYRAFQAI